jgi:hypothetical protein
MPLPDNGRAVPHVLMGNDLGIRVALGKKMRQRTIGRHALPRTFRSDPWGILGVGGVKRPGAKVYADVLHTRWARYVARILTRERNAAPHWEEPRGAAGQTLVV